MRANPTEAEKRLWTMLRDRRLAAYKFKRQFIIDFYIVDFVCLESRLIIEADGGQHADDPGDALRDAYLKREGFSVLRFWNNDVLNNSVGVFEAIAASLATPHPSAASRLPPSPARGEGFGEYHG